MNAGAVMFFAVTCGLLVLYMFSKGKYDGLIKPLDEKQFPMKGFMPAALYLMDAFRFTYTSGYNRKLLAKTAELYGIAHSQYYLKVHWANKIAYMYLALLLIALIGIGADMDAGFAVFAISILAGIFYFSDRELDEKIKKRRISIRRDFPDFVNKLILLINAGLTVSKAWEKAVSDSKKDSLLYKELHAVLASIRAGKPEQQAYEDFARRCKVPEISRFVSVILQNLRKGNAEMVPVLRMYASECWEARKSLAKKLGEEASTKLLLPMILMFVAILLIVAAPAVLMLRGI